MGTLKFVIVSVIYLLSYNIVQGKKLTAELCAEKLPTGRSNMASLYDCDDTIYLFGGNNVMYLTEALKYSIREDKIEVAALVPLRGPEGQAVMDKFKNIFWFGGFGIEDIYQYLPATQTFVNVSRFEYSEAHRTLIQPEMDSALIFGSNDAEIFVTSLNLSTLTSERIGRHPANVTYSDSIWVEGTDKAYMFIQDDILTYDRTNNRFASLGKPLPFQYGMHAVSDGRYIYLFGLLTKDDSDTGILLFDPEDEELSYVEVENKPRLDGPAIVYVEKLNRIYMFGGNGRLYAEDIYYISLDPMNM